MTMRANRSTLVTCVVLYQLVVALGLLAISVFLMWLTRTQEALKGPDATEAVAGMKVAAMVVTVPAVVFVIAVFGMWKCRLWGWWLALVTGLAMLGMLLYSMIDEGWTYIERDDIIATATCFITPVLLLLPKVRKFYRAEPRAAPSPGSSEGVSASNL
jgi:uncharacterized membrane protein (DUF2068 family)